LFPFPNRIRGGVFHWAGREYRLPINDPQQRNAIHGLVGDLPWSIGDSHREGYTTSLTGHFHLAEHAPQRLAYWPGDFDLTLTWNLAAETRDHELVWAELSAQVHVHNCGEVGLPFGLGFHPYFAVAADQAGIVIESARQKGADLRRWDLQALLPTGRLLPLDESYRPLLEASPTRPLPQWDDAFRYFPASDSDPLIVDLHDTQRGFTLRLEACPAFRDLVLFIPSHRQAICIEPYTCVTDAINLYAQGIASGLRVLPPGQTWQAQIRIRFLPST
jgi:aldose 1-epimerase